jgi:hypothetical protein
MKLVHKSLTPRISSICITMIFITLTVLAQDQGKPSNAFYSPEKGFKPAQANLTEIFLQLAGSLEHHGSPEPYIRHMQAENQRISILVEQKTGKPYRGMPAHLTDEYLNQFIANWNALSPKVALDELAKEAGKCTRNVLRGPRDTGTFVIEIINTHQEEVVQTMKGKSNDGSFEILQARLATELGFTIPNPIPLSGEGIVALVEREKTLTESERKEYAALLKHERFSKVEFGALDRFYKRVFDKLTEGGQAEISKRVWGGIRRSETDKHDAVKNALILKEKFADLFKRIDTTLPKDQAQQLQDVIKSFFIDIGRVAHSEFEIGMLEWAVK